MGPASAALLRFTLAAALLAAVSASYLQALSCPCGSTGTNYTFRNIYLSTTEEACRTWSRCLKCQDEVDYCLECPVGLFGPTCSTISCPDPGPVPNANHINANEDFHGSHRPGQSVKFDCHDGFELQGTSTLTCQESGTWSGKPPFCSRVAIPQPRTTTPEIRRARSADPNACPDPGLLPNGTRTVLRPLNPPPGIPAFPRGSHLKFGCENGFWLEGWDSLVCLTGGKWSSPLPTCRPYPPYEIYARYKTLDQKPPDDTLANCSNPGPLSNGWVRVQKPVYVPRGASISGYPTPKVRTPDEDHYPQDTRLAYSCDKGYWRTGGYSIDCKNTGLWSAKPPKCAKVCGTLLTNRDQDPEVEWPWMVGVASLSNETSHLICGGVLLDDRTVLTAATCFLRNGTFQLLFGKYTSRNQDNEDGVLQRTNYTVKIHPNFNHSTHTADIALVQFSPSITYSDRIQPICLPSNKTIIRNLALGRIGYRFLKALICCRRCSKHGKGKKDGRKRETENPPKNEILPFEKGGLERKVELEEIKPPSLKTKQDLNASNDHWWPSTDENQVKDFETDFADFSKENLNNAWWPSTEENQVNDFETNFADFSKGNLNNASWPSTEENQVNDFKTNFADFSKGNLDNAWALPSTLKKWVPDDSSDSSDEEWWPQPQTSPPKVEHQLKENDFNEVDNNGWIQPQPSPPKVGNQLEEHHFNVEAILKEELHNAWLTDISPKNMDRKCDDKEQKFDDFLEKNADMIWKKPMSPIEYDIYESDRAISLGDLTVEKMDPVWLKKIDFCAFSDCPSNNLDLENGRHVIRPNANLSERHLSTKSVGQIDDWKKELRRTLLTKQGMDPVWISSHDDNCICKMCLPEIQERPKSTPLHAHKELVVVKDWSKKEPDMENLFVIYLRDDLQVGWQKDEYLPIDDHSEDDSEAEGLL